MSRNQSQDLSHSNGKSKEELLTVSKLSKEQAMKKDSGSTERGKSPVADLARIDTKVHALLEKLHKSCQKENGTDDKKKRSQLLEVYAIEIQIYTETKDNNNFIQEVISMFICV